MHLWFAAVSDEQLAPVNIRGGCPRPVVPFFSPNGASPAYAASWWLLIGLVCSPAELETGVPMIAGGQERNGVLNLFVMMNGNGVDGLG